MQLMGDKGIAEIVSAGGRQDLGKPAIEELMIEWLNPLLTQDEADRLVGWYLGVNL